jgi:hypothetical protein
MSLGVPEVVIVAGVSFCLVVLVAVVVVLLVSAARKKDAAAAPADERRKCPHCAEWIMADAKVCRFCGRDV